MDIFLIALIVLCLWGVKFSATGHTDYISRSQTDSIKGIFAIIILYSHMRGYFVSDVPYSSGYNVMLNYLGQLMVVMFLLYSGYGIMEALKRNRKKYMDTFLTHRVGKVWLMFALAVGLFMLLNAILSIKHEPIKYLTSLIAWDSIGNSNWFVFDILVLYLLTYFALLISSKWGGVKYLVLAVYALTAALVIILWQSGKGMWWYDTILAYPTGMFYSIYKAKIEQMVRGWRWWLITFIIAALFIFCRFKLYILVDLLDNTFGYMLNFAVAVFVSSIFAMLVLLLTMKIKLDNPALRWLGVNAFAIYILQRLAMILGQHFGWNKNAVLFACFVIPATLLISAIYTAGTNRLNRKLFR